METLTTVNIPKRKETHKGDYGKILLIGGSANLGAQSCWLRVRVFIVEVD